MNRPLERQNKETATLLSQEPNLNHPTLKNWVNLLPGKVYVTTKEEMIRTILGSCVAVCLRDPIAKVAGMNHFLLPKKNVKKQEMVFALDSSDAARYGNWAMELLINEMLKNGAKKSRLECKVFGGANVIQGMTKYKIGDTNVEFVLDFLDIEGITVKNKDVGLEYPRKIVLNTATGQVEVKKMSPQSNNIFDEEKKLANKVANDDSLDDGIDFF